MQSDGTIIGNPEKIRTRSSDQVSLEMRSLRRFIQVSPRITFANTSFALEALKWLITVS